MKKILNPFVMYLPFLFIYLLYVWLFHDDNFIFDENKYMMFAQNILNGYYSSPPPNQYIGVGPGYPLFLTPFIFLNLPLISISFCNAIFKYLSIVYFHKLLNGYIKNSIVIVISIFWAIFPNSFEYMHLGLPENLPPFLIILFLYFIDKSLVTSSKLYNWYVILSGIVLGYLVLTKVIFGYVVLFSFVAFLIQRIFRGKSVLLSKMLIIFVLSFLVTLPYLAYTYNETGRLFYWGTTGGNNLYWMSSPVDGEYGDWFPYHTLEIDTSALKLNKLREEKMKFNHFEDHQKFLSLDGVEQDDAYKEAAMRNILNNPQKFILNCICNLGRIFFNYPYSYSLQNPNSLFRIPFSGAIAFLMILCFYPTLLNWRKLPATIQCSFIFSVLYLGGSMLGSAETRMLTIIAPVILFWIAYISTRLVKINWTFDF